MKKISLSSLVFILFILQSCTFEPKGEEFVTINPTGSIPNIEINLNLAVDTIFVPFNQKVTFAYGLHGDKVNWAQFVINGVVQNNRDFAYDVVDYSWTFNDAPGKIYPMELKIFTKSQTGSIADKMGAEGFLISRKWIVVITNEDKMASRVIKTDFVNGRLRVEWEKYKGVDFVNYKLYKSMPYGTPNSYLLATINSSTVTSFVDTTYHGELSGYYIVNNDRYSGFGPQIQGPLPVIRSENAANGDLVLKWDKPPYYNNLKSYRISLKDRYGSMQQITELPIASGESYMVPNPLFGHSYEFYITPVALSDNHYSTPFLTAFLSTYTTASYGLTIPKYTSILSGEEPVSYMLNDNSSVIMQFDHRTFTTTRTIKYKEIVSQFFLSQNCKYMVTRVNINQKIYLEDLTDSTKSKSINISSSFPQMQYTASVSNSGTGIMINNKTAVMYDYINERKLAEILLPGSGSYYSKISGSGNFFFMLTTNSSEYYQYKDNQMVLLQTETNQGIDQIMKVEYLPGNNEKLVRVYNNRLEVVDCNTWTIEKKWIFPAVIQNAYNVDIKSGKMLLCEKTKLILFDVMNGTREEVATIDDFGYMDWTFFYKYGQLLWGKGAALKL